MRRYSPLRGRTLTPYEAAAERFAASPAGTWLFLHAFAVADRRLLALTRGRLSVTPGAPVGLLETVGARSGRRRRTPVLYVADGAALVLVASNGGGAQHPAWLHNVRAHPDVRFLARGARWQAYRAGVAAGTERERLWRLATDLFAGYARYQAHVPARTLPVVVLTGGSALYSRAMALSPETLKQVPLFSELSNRDLKQLAGAMNERTYAAGRTVTVEGETGLGFFVIADGTATVTVDGQPRGGLGKGDYFGEIALIDGGRRTARVTAETDLTCYGMTAWNFRPFLRDHPDLVWALLQALVARLRATESRTRA